MSVHTVHITYIISRGFLAAIKTSIISFIVLLFSIPLISLPCIESDLPELGLDLVDHIKNCLLQGCRSIKIDCFDGPEGPVVSRTTLQTLDQVLGTINESAFTSSP